MRSDTSKIIIPTIRQKNFAKMQEKKGDIEISKKEQNILTNSK